MAENMTARSFEEGESASEHGKYFRDLDSRVNAWLLQSMSEALPSLDEDAINPADELYYDSAEDADDELDTGDDDDDYEDLKPLNIKKAKTGEDSAQGMYSSSLKTCLSMP